jgi:hypothetical protein
MNNVVNLVADHTAAAPELRDVAACLRNLAASIDRGDCGEVVRAAVVLRSAGRVPIVAGQGDTDTAQAFMDLHAGAAELMAMMSPGRS